MTLRARLRGALELALPDGCVVCRSWIPRRAERLGPELVCGRCRAGLGVAGWPRCVRCHHPRGTGRPTEGSCLHCGDWPTVLERARYAHALEGPASDLVHALKYEGWPELAPFMGRRMAAAARRDGLLERGDAPPLVVPVPTTVGRARRRGYNQAGLLAGEVAADLGLRVADALVRVGASASQTTLDPTRRRANVDGAFAPAPDAGRALRGARVLLVDDVLTTGATAAEAARVLGASGAVGVELVTFARALSRLSERAA